MAEAVEAAHRAIRAEIRRNPQLQGMGTTVVAVLFHRDAAIIAHVGDSCVYQLRRGSIVFRTDDHSMVAEMVRNNELLEEQARVSMQSNIITRALGVDGDNRADIAVQPYERGDRFLLCTDGIWGALPENELVKRADTTKSLPGAVDSIVITIDEQGRKTGNTHDNLTMALFEMKQDSKIKEKMNRKAIKIIKYLTVGLVVSLLANFLFGWLLMKPRDRQQRIEQLEETISNRDSTIIELKSTNESLRQEITQYKNKVADVRNEGPWTISQASARKTSNRRRHSTC